MIHLCFRLIKLESHSGVKSRAQAALFVVLPSARVRLHARLSTKLGNCPVTADKHLLVQIIPESGVDGNCVNTTNIWTSNRSKTGGGFGLRMSAPKDKRKEYLTVKDLQRVLDSCKLHLNEVDEVWPKIYIGNV